MKIENSLRGFICPGISWLCWSMTQQVLELNDQLQKIMQQGMAKVRRIEEAAFFYYFFSESETMILGLEVPLMELND